MRWKKVICATVYVQKIMFWKIPKDEQWKDVCMQWVLCTEKIICEKNGGGYVLYN